MLTPKVFSENRIEKLHALINLHPLGIMISYGADGLQQSSIPFLLYPQEGEFGVLRAHMARANSQWKSFSNAECLILFQGEDSYISPSWYPNKAETHREVPTWNYITVEVRGVPLVIEDTQWLHRQIKDLSDYHESVRPQPWSVNDAPADYISSQLKGIVGIEISISSLIGKCKMSQNKTATDRQGVIQGMRDKSDPHFNLLLADIVESCKKDE